MDRLWIALRVSSSPGVRESQSWIMSSDSPTRARTGLDELHEELEAASKAIAELDAWEQSQLAPRPDGLCRLTKALTKERDFLVRTAAKTHDHELRLTLNLTHLTAIVDCLRQIETPVLAVGRRVAIDERRSDRAPVDIVCSEGGSAPAEIWLCIRVTRSLCTATSWEDDGGLLLAKTVEVLSAARLRTLGGVPCTVSYFFPNGASAWLVAQLEGLGVSIWPSKRKSPPQLLLPECVNLDCTTLVALCSQMCHEDQRTRSYEHTLLEMQRMEESAEPMLHTLRLFLAGKRWVCCQAAMEQFEAILLTKAGEKERARWTELRSAIALVKNQQPQWIAHLELSRTVRPHTKLIFGSGVCQSKGLHIAAHVHPARSLTGS